MSRQITNPPLDQIVVDWLVSKGVNTDLVRPDYTITRRENKPTLLTITLYADDFPLALHGVVGNRPPHPTCIDITPRRSAEEKEWACTDKCPPVLSNDTTNQHDTNAPLHSTCAETTTYKELGEGKRSWVCSQNCPCPHGYRQGDHHWYSCMNQNPFPDEGVTGGI